MEMIFNLISWVTIIVTVASLIAASMLLPTTVLANSIRPGSVTHKTLNQRAKGPSCLVLLDDG